jgi:hypothetical protein
MTIFFISVRFTPVACFCQYIAAAAEINQPNAKKEW